MDCDECKKELKCCGGYLYNIIPFIKAKEIKDVRGKLDFPKIVQKIYVEGMPLKRISRFEWKCEWFVDGKCIHYDLRPDICRDFFCKEHNKGEKKMRYLNSLYGIKCP